jgi:ATP-dependent exoDNAse (exonuclease V) beta subunit
MPHFVDALRAEAEAAIAAMREAALRARQVHARAELMRHMLLTAHKVKHKPKPEAVEAVVAEWMKAWHLTRSDWPQLARQMEAFTATFYDYANDPSDTADAALRDACSGLDAALANEATSISDQMAWRSQCAHGWWDMVSPTPRDLPGRVDREMVPDFKPGVPFWEVGCADMCKT